MEKLKSSLDDAINHHKKAMDENEKLLADLKKSNNHSRVGNRSFHFLNRIYNHSLLQYLLRTSGK